MKRPATTNPRGILIPVLVSVISFVIGILFTTVIQTALSPIPAILTNQTIFSSLQQQAVYGPVTDPTSPSPIPPQPPLALRWYQAGYKNPWSFSVSRTGVEDLYQTYFETLKHDGKLPRVVVSFTSLPNRFVKHARSMILILKKQSYLPDKIYVCIPKTSRRSDEKFHIPSWIADDPLIKVLRPPVDYGPATKLIPALEEELKLGNLRTRVITVDDDNEGGWHDDSLMGLYLYSLRFPDATIGLTGWNVTCMVSKARCSTVDSGVPRRQHRDRFYNFIKPSDDYACHSLFDWLPSYFDNCLGAIRKNFVAYVDVLEGYKGVLYQPRFFDIAKLKTLVDKSKTPDFFLCDDVWFSGWLSIRNVKRIAVNPALYHDAPVRIAMMKQSKRRNLSTAVLNMTEEDVQKTRSLQPAEPGLHSLGGNFVEANHDSVRWFERKGGWTKGMWDQPKGYRYPSEELREEKMSKEAQNNVQSEFSL